VLSLRDRVVIGVLLAGILVTLLCLVQALRG